MKEKVLAIAEQLPPLSPELARLADQITFPPRTDNNPGVFDRGWIDEINFNWPTFRTVALELLSTRTDSPNINLLPITESDLYNEFILPKPVLRDEIINMRGKDLRYIYRYFALGKEIGSDDNQEPLLRIKRMEMLQLYIAAFARKYLLLKHAVPEVQYTELSYEESSAFAYLNRLMRTKPERGGPLLNAR